MFVGINDEEEEGVWKITRTDEILKDFNKYFFILHDIIIKNRLDNIFVKYLFDSLKNCLSALGTIMWGGGGKPL